MTNFDFNNFIDVMSVVTISKIIFSFVLIITLILLKKLIHQVIRKQIKSNKTIYKWKRTSNSVLMLLGLLILGFLWFSSLGSFTAFIGLVTAALAFALRDIVTDLAGYVFVMIRRPFQVSDRIQIGETKGDVLQIEWFQITLLEVGNWVNQDQSTGRIIYMPIGQVLTQTIFNYTAGFDWIWNEISVLMTFESNWEKAKKIILDIIAKQDLEMNQNIEKKLKKAMQHHLIEYSNIKPIVYTNTTDSGINLTVRYLCPPKMRRISEHNFWESLLKTFGTNESLSMAYPTIRHINT
tara:strand:+ start:521 stop:1402 length:882 start_codon:yes stop_codon:yes gene_type:complete